MKRSRLQINGNSVLEMLVFEGAERAEDGFVAAIYGSGAGTPSGPAAD